MLKRLTRAIHRHLSAADERFGLRLGAGLAGTLAAAVTFALLLLLVRAGWGPLRSLDTAAAIRSMPIVLSWRRRPRWSATSSTRMCFALCSR